METDKGLISRLPSEVIAGSLEVMLGEMASIGVPIEGRFLIRDGVIYREVIDNPGYWVNVQGDVLGPSGSHIVADSHYTGYRKVHLRSNKAFVHRVVMTAWMPHTLQDSLVVNHKDLDKSNNCLDNLEWVTQGANIIHSVSSKVYRDKLLSDLKERIVANPELSGRELLDILDSL